jgi:predicted transposase YbfD/YdcC
MPGCRRPPCSSNDPRQAWKVACPLLEILLVVLCGLLRRLLPFRRGVLSHNTLNDVVNALDARTFAECFTAWVAGLRDAAPEIVAIDGRTSRRARRGEAHPLHPVSARASRQRLVIGQEAITAKGNEATAIPLLLERLEQAGALVTIDAIGCQRGIAEAISGKGADYLLALKDNRPALAGEVGLFFDRAPAGSLDTHQTVDADHGRIETRRHAVSCEVGWWLTTDRRFPGQPRFPALAAIAMVEAEAERGGRLTKARRYYLTSAELDARGFARAVRAHWGVENRLHWVMDVVFHDDLMRLRTEHGPANMATVRHIALNLLRAVPGTQSLAVKRNPPAGTKPSSATLSSRPAECLQAIPMGARLRRHSRAGRDLNRDCWR